MFAQLERKSAQPEVKLNLWRSIYLILDFSWSCAAEENVGIKTITKKEEKKDDLKFHSYFPVNFSPFCIVY